MTRLEELSNGSIVEGLLSGEAVTVVSTKWYGSSSMEVFYKTNRGATGSQILYREDEPSLTVLEKSLPWSFDVGGDKLRLVSEAYRIHLAHLFDPYLAVHTSAIEPLPHQISAVYEAHACLWLGTCSDVEAEAEKLSQELQAVDVDKLVKKLNKMLGN